MPLNGAGAGAGFVALFVLVVGASVGFVAGPIGALILAGAAVGVALLVVTSQQLTQVGSAGRGSAPEQPDEGTSSGFLSDLTNGLWFWILGSLALRLGVAIFVNATPLWLSFGPDSLGWENRGYRFLELLTSSSWADGNIELWTFYPIVNAAAIALFGSARYPVALLNCFAGVGVAILGGWYASRLFGLAVGRRALLLLLFYPSLLLWGAMNIRDVWAHAVLFVVLISADNARKRFAPLSLALLLGALLLLSFIRPYLLSLVLVAVGVSLLVLRPRQLPYAALLLASLTFLGQIYGGDLPLLGGGIEEQLETVTRMRQGLAYGGSAYGGTADTRTIQGALAYLPYGIAKFLFSPFPWEVRSWQQMLALPESLVFVSLSYQAVRGTLRSLVHQTSRVALPLSLFIVVTVAYALVSGNEGTAFRHRSQVVIVVLIFSAAWQVREARRPRPSGVSVPDTAPGKHLVRAG